ncbi:MAG: ATP-dependent DNA helicase RecG [Planctomycetales bacterium]|nr:ATP-dependent DNA helicase RecG [Planctomycetales bacterium]
MAEADSLETRDPLNTPVQYVPGVGRHWAAVLMRLGLTRARDVLFHFPRDYQDYTDLRTVAEFEDGALHSAIGTIEDVETVEYRGGRMRLGLLVRSGDESLRVTWFNQRYLVGRFQEGQRILVSGKAKRDGLRWEMAHPRFQILDEEEDEPTRGALLPVYPSTERLSQPRLRSIVQRVVADAADAVPEVFPPSYLDAHNLPGIGQAIRQIHFPENHDQLAAARRRFVYQELLILQLALAIKQQQQHTVGQAPALEPTAKIDARIRRLFPFELTPGQNRAIDEITADTAGTIPMNRLLQADVGAGKTVVAAYLMLLAVAHGFQAALMAPTEVLARQHATTLGRLLSAARVRQALLSGSMKSAERDEVKSRLAEGALDIVVGTQAMIQGDVEFANLAVVVIDEQHKFGVTQRAALRAGDRSPHYLVMTATPIPRTIAMTAFGDLDVTRIDDTPPGRQQVHTYLAEENERSKWWEFFCKKLDEGRQGYVIAPLVEDSDRLDVTSVEAAYEALCNGPLEAYRVGLIHGRLSSDDKEAVMERFRRGDIQVLVATTVIEVGVDVPNATLMTIEGGERFGLSQLHQLRGRISRGAYAGYCCVFAAMENDASRARLEAFRDTPGGFELAEIDFRLRGPGELFGTRQHGLPPMRIADLGRDTELLSEARRDAQQLVREDPGLASPDHRLLRAMVIRRYGKALSLGDVG